ncbi:hypothetical protein CU254_18410 [Amycolatopsis sp. AA4]|uniref:hypothetical protein n=1 Tax=Actinomycetes TaxID=1760 RepID=UPI0001B565BB|nr:MULTISPECIES: hypothetical protein [Actinomycetes]ATY12221.1 hypothetical protein CU254_18410 [Amycolatopsis sp. AA4]
MADSEWTIERAQDFDSLRGRRIESWAGVEMAVREHGPDGGPQFTDPAVPCLQLWGMQAYLDDGRALMVGTYQDDDGFGLWPHRRPDPRLEDRQRWDGIYRWSALGELPTGPVEDVVVFAEEDVLAEVDLRVGGQPLHLVAGELEECGPRLSFVRLDESVLVFTDPAAAERVNWSTPRRPRVRIDPWPRTSFR